MKEPGVGTVAIIIAAIVGFCIIVVAVIGMCALVFQALLGS